MMNGMLLLFVLVGTVSYFAEAKFWCTKYVSFEVLNEPTAALAKSKARSYLKSVCLASRDTIDWISKPYPKIGKMKVVKSVLEGDYSIPKGTYKCCGKIPASPAY